MLLFKELEDKQKEKLKINLNMVRTKFKDRELPKYTKGEEIFNMVSHIVGGALGITALVLCVVFSAIHHKPYSLMSSIIYGVSMIILYTISSIYHGLRGKGTSKKVFQVLDHCSIFLLIAGSYTPFALVTIMQVSTVEGWAIFGSIWSLAIIGIILNSIDIKKFNIISMILEIAMGWCIIFRFNIIIQALSIPAIILLVLGGIIYTLGAIFYGLGRKIKYMHAVFHLCVLTASILHFLCILLFVI